MALKIELRILLYILSPVIFLVWLFTELLNIRTHIYNLIGMIGADFVVLTHNFKVVTEQMNAFPPEFVGKNKYHKPKRWRLDRAVEYAQKIDGCVDWAKWYL